MAEVTGLRSRHAKHFTTDTPGQFEARITSGPQHFLDTSDAWQDMADLVQPVAGGWAAVAKDVRFGVESGYLKITYRGRSLTMRPASIYMVDRTAPATRNRKLADASYANVTRDGNVITVHDIFPQTDLRVTITDEEMAKAFTVRVRPNYPDPASLGWNPANTYVGIVWDVTKPAGAVIRDTVTRAVVGSGYIGNNDLVVEDNLGNPVVYFKAGTAISAAGKTNPVWYASFGAAFPFVEAFPYAKAMIATYPLVLDPTTSVNISTSADDGYIENGVGSYAYTNPIYVGSGTWSDGKSGGDAWYRGFWRFNLVSIPSGATCSAANLNFRAGAGAAAADTYTLYKVPDWEPLDVNDWATTPLYTEGSVVIANSAAEAFRAWSITGSHLNSHFGTMAVAAFRMQGTRAAGVTDGALIGQSFNSNQPLYYPYLSITYTTTGGPTTQTGSLAANAVIRRTQAGSSLAGAVLRKTQTGTFIVAASITSSGAGAFPAEAVVRVVGSATLVLEAMIQRPQNGTLTTDAIVLRGESAALTADAITQVPRDGAFSADAVLINPLLVTGFTVLEAVVSRSWSVTIAINAVVRGARSSSFTATALLKTVSQASFPAQAVMEATRMVGIATAAVLRSPRGSTFTADAAISRRITRHIESISSARTIAAMVASRAIDFTVYQIRRSDLSLDAEIE